MDTTETHLSRSEWQNEEILRLSCAIVAKQSVQCQEACCRMRVHLAW